MDAESDVIKNCTVWCSNCRIEERYNSINYLRYAWYRALVIPKCSVLDPDIQIGELGKMLGGKWTTEYVFRIHDLNIINWEFKDALVQL